MIIGLTGPAGSGKTTAAKYLVERYGATRFSFAEPLKRMAMMIYGLTEEQVFGPLEAKEAVDPRHGKSPRELLQFLGTDVCRTHLGPDVWANAALAKLEPGRLYVCDDVRFDNEARAIRNRCGVVWMLDTTGAPKSAHTAHASEAGVAMSLVSQYLYAPFGDINALKRGIAGAYRDALGDSQARHEGWYR